jgi:glycosyltransferase involved in cell wall biosynthesis
LLGDNRGFILNEDSEKEIAEKIDFLLNNKIIAKDMGVRSRKYIMQNYCWDEVARKTEELYTNLSKNANM